MIKTAGWEVDQSGFRAKTIEAINRMLGCLLGDGAKNCKNCDKVDPCRFVAEAIFAYRCRETVKSLAN